MKTLAKALILVTLTTAAISPVYGQANGSNAQTQGVTGTDPRPQGVTGTDPRPQGVTGTDPRPQSIWAAVLEALGL